MGWIWCAMSLNIAATLPVAVTHRPRQHGKCHFRAQGGGLRLSGKTRVAGSAPLPGQVRARTAAWRRSGETSIAQSLLGESPAMRQVRDLIERVARSQAPVYISGESGSGKELAARLIHQLADVATPPSLQ